MMPGENFKKLKGDQRKWAIEEAASTLRRYAQIVNEPELLDEAKKVLDSQDKEIKDAKRFVNAMNANSPSLKQDSQ